MQSISYMGSYLLGHRNFKTSKLNDLECPIHALMSSSAIPSWLNSVFSDTEQCSNKHRKHSTYTSFE